MNLESPKDLLLVLFFRRGFLFPPLLSLISWGMSHEELRWDMVWLYSKYQSEAAKEYTNFLLWISVGYHAVWKPYSNNCEFGEGSTPRELGYSPRKFNWKNFGIAQFLLTF